MSDLKDFVIKDSVLTKYVGPGGDVVIPEGVATIGTYAFYNQININSIKIPDSVKIIKDTAFRDCKNLQLVTIPKNINYIGADVFKGCESLVDKDGFIILNDRLYHYYGDSLDVTIPQNVTVIVRNAFEEHSKLRTVRLPSNVRTIEQGAFISWKNKCYNLEEIIFDSYEVYSDSCLLNLYDEFADTKNKLVVLKSFLKYLPKFYLLETGIDKKIKANKKDLLDVFIKDDDDDLVAKFFSMNKKVSLDLINEVLEKSKNTVKVKQFLILYKESAYPNGDQHKKEIVPQSCEQIHIEQYVKEKILGKKFPKELDTIKIGVEYTNNRGKSSVDVIKFFLINYIAVWLENRVEFRGAMSTGYNLGELKELKYPENAEKIAAELEPERLSKFLEKLIYGNDYRLYCLAFGRFASENAIQGCVKEIVRKRKGTAKEKYWAQNMQEAIYYSETLSAREHIEKFGDLNRYAKLHGTTVQELRDRASVPDFGFDENGTITYYANGDVIDVKIVPNMELTLFNVTQNKVIKSIPKNSLEGIEAAKAFANLKKETQNFYKKRVEYLKTTYITGEKITSSIWNDVYMGSPLFKPLVEAVIWQDQNGILFEVSDGSPYDVLGREYAPIGDIAVAHILSMSIEDVSQWQKRLIQTNKKLIVEQVWEPVTDLSTDKDCLFDKYHKAIVTKFEKSELKRRLTSKGIKVVFLSDEGDYDHRANKYIFPGTGTMKINDNFEMRYSVDESSGDTTFGLVSIASQISDRELNAIIYELNRSVIRSIILRDDADLLDRSTLSTFTQAQICEFTELATKSGSVKCTTTLLDYKNKNSADFDPMEEFVLE